MKWLGLHRRRDSKANGADNVSRLGVEVGDVDIGSSWWVLGTGLVVTR